MLALLGVCTIHICVCDCLHSVGYVKISHGRESVCLPENVLFFSYYSPRPDEIYIFEPNCAVHWYFHVCVDYVMLNFCISLDF